MSNSDKRTEERARSRREQGHFDQVVEASEQFYWADRTEAGLRRQTIRSERIARAAHFQPGWRVLDVGCGTGLYTTRLSSDEQAAFDRQQVTPRRLHLATAS